MKTILIAVPTNRYIEPETMKSIYDLWIPADHGTEFQFFYGYQIDQIRNLIGDWGRNYDYVLHVDSDIVLPPDTLVKMIESDKDIVTGMYIQRIANTHTLELYGFDGNNIDISQIEDTNLFEVNSCGFGCVLVKGNVYRTIPQPMFEYHSALDHKDTISEDTDFCIKARKNGFTIWADPTIMCEHIGKTVYDVGLVNTTMPVMSPPVEDHLETISKQDLLPKAHADYLKQMDAEPKVVYDIGACVLHWTRKAKEVWPQAEYFLFDAAKAVEKFHQRSGHPYYNGVLADMDDRLIEFYEDVDNPGGNSYYLENTGAFTEQHKSSRIGMSLDTIVERNQWPMPDLIKMDVQGAEVDILKGATKCLNHVTDVILEAQHVPYNDGAPLAEDVINYMTINGFEYVGNFCKGNVDGDYHFRRLL